MPVHPWHPYAPDQAFGRQAARDEELVDAVVAALQARRRQPPRAANRATPASEPSAAWRPRGGQLRWTVGATAGLPVTTATALDAAARIGDDDDS
jgi:hypothetical protein